MPEELATIENGYNEVYEKRHQRIEEKKAVLLVQEKTKAKGHEITQPEEQQQPERDCSLTKQGAGAEQSARYFLS